MTWGVAVRVAEPGELDRLWALARVVRREAEYLAQTDGRLFDRTFDADRVRTLQVTPELAERVDAFVARFGRLQDTLADKLLPALLRQLAEPVRSAVENLDRAEKLGLLDSADAWLETRRLRNRMIHEYVEDPAALALGLMAGHAQVPLLLRAAQRFCERVEALRGPLG